MKDASNGSYKNLLGDIGWIDPAQDVYNWRSDVKRVLDVQVR